LDLIDIRHADLASQLAGDGKDGRRASSTGRQNPWDAVGRIHVEGSLVAEQGSHGGNAAGIERRGADTRPDEKISRSRDSDRRRPLQFLDRAFELRQVRRREPVQDL
jgi:hypothetical protein